MIDKSLSNILIDINIIQKDDGWYLQQSEKSSNSINKYRNICRILQINNIYGVDLSLLWEAILYGKEVYKIADQLFQDSPEITNVSCIVRKDFKEAFLNINAEPTSYPTKEDLYYVLLQNNVILGIDNSVIGRLVREKEVVQNLKVATWQEPVPGKPAQLIWEIELRKDIKPLISEDGTVDLKQLGRYQSVRKNDIIVRKLPPVKGKDGWKINGEVVDSTGEDVNFPAGKNTKISEDKLSLIAGVSGHIYLSSDLVHIDEVLVINGNVDFSVGHIDYIGEVIVRGDVLPDFNVISSGNVFIMGSVEAGQVISREGEVVIEGGIIGYKKARVVSAGRIKAKYAQDAYLNSGEMIEVERYMINCDATAGDSIIVKANDGVIRGGVNRAGKKIEAGFIGSVSRTKTVLEIGSSQDGEYLEKLNDIDQKISSVEGEISSINRKLKFWDLLKERLGNLNPEKRKEYFELQKEKDELLQELQTLKNRKNEISNEPSEIVRDSALKVRKLIYPGSIIRFGENEIPVEKEMTGSEILTQLLNRR